MNIKTKVIIIFQYWNYLSKLYYNSFHFILCRLFLLKKEALHYTVSMEYRLLVHLF